MSVLTPHLRQADVLGQPGRHLPATVDAVQTEVQAMQSIVRALAAIPDNRARARVLAWASAVFPFPNAGADALESFHPEGRLQTRSTGVPRPTLVEDEGPKRQPIKMPPAELTAVQRPSPNRPEPDVVSSPASESLSAEDADALPIKDVDSLFDDTRPRQGQFPAAPSRPRVLRPRLVLRFRLWR
jgi:hypothetical protein